MGVDLEADFLADAGSTGQVTSREAIRRERMARWLDVYATAGWREACAATGCADADVLRWRRLHPEFREAMEARNDAVALALEEMADAIAKGEVTATTPQVQMIQFRLRGLRPEVYRERSSVEVKAAAAAATEGDAGRARLLLAEWTAAAAAPAARHRAAPDPGHGTETAARDPQGAAPPERARADRGG